MLFNDVIGQKKVKEQLLRSVQNNRISHAQMFLGPEGSGNLALAVAYAQYINCENPSEGDSCNTCTSCIKYKKLVHPDLHFVFPVNTSSQVSKNPKSDDYIKTWRELLLDNPYFTEKQWYHAMGVGNKQGIIGRDESYEIIRKLSYKSFEAKYKTVILWLPEKMNQSAANKLLKQLEEPSSDTVFLFVSVDADNLLPTIISRMQTIKVPRLEPGEIEEALITTKEQEQEEARRLSKIANGSWINALELLHPDEEKQSNFDLFVRLMRLCYKAELLKVQAWVDEIAPLGRERQKSFLVYALCLIRENLMLNQQLPDIAHLSKEEYGFSEKFNPFINHRNVYDVYEELNRAHSHIESNGYAKLVFFDLSLKLMQLLKR